MKRFLVPAFILVTGIALAITLMKPDDPKPLVPLTFKVGDPYDKEWKQVDSLTNQGLPKSALEIIEKIYDKALKEKNDAQIIKALLYKAGSEYSYEEEGQINNIIKLEQQLPKINYPAQPVLQSILADIYWRYYQQQRWQIQNRTETAGVVPDDIRTWDAAKFVSKVSELYFASLQNEDSLKRTALGIFDSVLVQGEGSKNFRPTLYDFLVHRALEFFSNSETGLMKPAYQFTISDADYFGSAEQFVKLKIESKDSTSFELQSLLLLQKLLAFHLGQNNRLPVVDNDLQRLQFVHRHSVHDLKDSLYLAALKKLESKYEADTVSARVGYAIAQQLVEEGSKYNHETAKEFRWLKKAAFEKCEEVIKRHPGTLGANNCRALKEQILQKSLSVTVEEVSVPKLPFRAMVQYQNLATVWLRVVKLSKEQQKEYESKEWNERRDYLLNREAVQQWEQSLPDAKDYNIHSAEIKIPALEPGKYYLLVSSTKEFLRSEGGIAYASFSVSNLSYVSRRKDDSSLDFYVSDRTTGKPLSGVAVQAYTQEYNYTSRKYEFKKAGNYKTDQDGYFRIPSADKHSQVRVELTYKDDYLFEDNSFYTYRNYGDQKEKWDTRTFFFLDRAIYRPGQTVHFKGLVLSTNGKANEIKKNYSLTVELKDVNYQKVSEVKVVTNDFGTFHATFTLPQGTLNGNFHIMTESGNQYFRVEDYKRPKFEVTFKPVTGSFRLNDSVTVEGSAVSYAGANLSDAQVQYRVQRVARFPFWWGWFKSIYPPKPAMEITNGVATTDENGNFKITFKAIPDATVDKSSNPVFDYTIEVDVTDLNGETQSNKTTASVGYQALQAEIDVKEVLFTDKPDTLHVAVKNLNGQPENAKGTITVSKLKEPDRLLRDRLWERADTFTMTKDDYVKNFSLDVYADEDRVESWQVESKVFDATFNTETSKDVALKGLSGWKPGKYVVELLTKDKFGAEVKEKKFITVYNPVTKAMPTKILSWFHAVKSTGEPGETAKFLIGSSGKDVKVLYEVFSQNATSTKQWLELSSEVKTIEVPITEAHRGNIAVSFLFTKNGRCFSSLNVITVPYTNKELKIETTTFRDKLLPGAKEEWRLKITGSKGEKAAAELLAGMYDASLDAFVAHNWNFSIYLSYYYHESNWQKHTFGTAVSNLFGDAWNKRVFEFKEQRYDRLNWFLLGRDGDYFIDGVRTKAIRGGSWKDQSYLDKVELRMTSGGVPANYGDATGGIVAFAPPTISEGEEFRKAADQSSANNNPQTTPVSPRKNLQETAFFFPDLKTDTDGNIVFSFTAPEALTRWKLMTFAHTQDLKFGMLTKETVTQKELMVTPNAPRFFRENDKITFASKISNVSEKDLSGKVQLLLFDALTMKPVDAQFANSNNEKAFSVKRGGNTAVSWDLKIPEGISAVLYRVVASAENFSDGEENALPVLTNRMLVTETLPLNVRAGQTKTFKFDKLINHKSTTLRNQKLTLEFTSNPAWYAVQALPYLMEYPYECSEQVFNRYYSNSIASGIANSNPRIKQVFASWNNLDADALVSNLAKNQELKLLLLEETPWVLDGQDETERKKRIALLFDLNKMASEKQSNLKKLAELQTPNGGWAWFKGMRDNRHITQYIVTGLAKLHTMGTLNLKEEAKAKDMLQQAVTYLDTRLLDDYNDLIKNKAKLDEDHLGYEQVQYLYARTMLTAEFPVRQEVTTAFNYYMGQAEKYWLPRNKYSQGMIALALHRNGKKETALKITRSLKENALTNEEMGMYWKENSGGFYWYQAPIETQALLVEAFKFVANDKKSVDEMRIWLLKQKQTQDWGTTKATADACYALLLEGTQWLDDSKLADITVGGVKVDPAKEGSVEAGTGYFKTSWDKTEIKPEMGNITVAKQGEGIGWGAMYWQYFEQLDKITPAATPLNIKKQLFVQSNSDRGPVITPITEKTQLKVGDLVKVRIELRVDRAMEFVHMKDMRAAGFEPVNVLSGYKWQGGLGYYESTRDAATNFFFDWLPKGTYVFEYPLRVSQTGDFSNGITTIQCMYAPEFSSHSEGVRVLIR